MVIFWPRFMTFANPCFYMDGNPCKILKFCATPRALYHPVRLSRRIRWMSRCRPLRLEFLPRYALSISGRHATVGHHDRDALGPDLAKCLWHGERWASRCRSSPDLQHARHPRLIHVLVPPIRCRLEYRHLLAPQRGLPAILILEINWYRAVVGVQDPGS